MLLSAKKLSIILSIAVPFGACTDVVELVKRISGINVTYNLDVTPTALPLDQFMASEMITNYGAPSTYLCGGDGLSKFPRFRPALDMYRSEFDDVLGEAEIVSKYLSQSQKWKSYFNGIREIYPIVLSVHDNNKLSAPEKRFYRYYGTKNDSYVVDYHRVAQRFDNQTVGRVLIMKKQKKIIVSLRVPEKTSIKVKDIPTFQKDIYALALRSQAAIVPLLLDRTGNNMTALHEYELTFTGFGHGGSLATLASTLMYLDSSMNFARCGLNSNFHNQIKLVTFGASMVFSESAALNFPLRPENHWRFMHPDHKFTPLVPGLPLKHVGVEVKAPKLPFNNMQLMKSGRGYLNSTIIDEVEAEMKKERLQIFNEMDERNLGFANMMNFPKDSAAEKVKQMLFKKVSESWFLFEKGSDAEIIQSILKKKTSKDWDMPGLLEMYSQIMSSGSLTPGFKMQISEAFVKSSPWENEAKGIDKRAPSLNDLPDKTLPLNQNSSEANQCDPAKISNLLSSFFNIRSVHSEFNNITSFNDGKPLSDSAIFNNEAGVTCVTTAGGKGLDQHKINCYYIPTGSSNLKTHAFNVFQFSGFGSKRECYEKGTKLGSLYTGSMTQAESCFQSTVANVFNRPSLPVSLNDYNLFKVSNSQSQCFEMTSSILGSEKCFLTTNSGFEPLLKVIKTRGLDNVLWKAYKVPVDLISSEVCQKYSLAAYWQDRSKSVAPPSHQLSMQVEMGFLSAFPFTSLFRGFKVTRLATLKYKAGYVSNFNSFSFMESSPFADNNDLPLSALHKTYFPLLEALPQTLFHMCVKSDLVPWIDCTRKENQAIPSLCPSHCAAIEFAKDAPNNGRHLFCQRVKACRGALPPGTAPTSIEAKVLFVSFTESAAKEMNPNTTTSVRQFFKALSNSTRPSSFQDHQVFIELEESTLSSSEVFTNTSATKSSARDGNRKRVFLSFSFMDHDIKNKGDVDAEKEAVAQGDIRYKKFDWLNYVALARAKGVQQIVYPTIIEASLERNAESLDRIIKLILKPDFSPEIPNFFVMSQEQINQWKEDRIAEYAYKATDTPVIKDEIPELALITILENFTLQKKYLNLTVTPPGASDPISRNVLLRKLMMKYIYNSIRSLCVMFSIFKTGNQDFNVNELKARVDGLDKLINRMIYDYNDVRYDSEAFPIEMEYRHNVKFVVKSVLSLLELSESDIFIMHEIELTQLLMDHRTVFLNHFRSFLGERFKSAEFRSSASLILAAVFFDLDRVEPVGVLEAMAFQNVVNDFAYKTLLTAYAEGTPDTFKSLGTKSLDILSEALEAEAIPKLLETQIYNDEFIVSTVGIDKIAKTFSSNCQTGYKNALAQAKKMKDADFLKELEDNKPKCLNQTVVRLNDAFTKIMKSRASYLFRKQLYNTIKRKTISYLSKSLNGKELTNVMSAFDELKVKGNVTVLPMPSELSNQGIMTYLNFGKTMGLAPEFSYILIYRGTGSDVIHLGLRMKFSMAEYLQKHSGKIASRTVRLGLVALQIAVIIHPFGMMLATPFLAHAFHALTHLGPVGHVCHASLLKFVINPHLLATKAYNLVQTVHASFVTQPGFKATSKEDGINFSLKSYVAFNSMLYNESPLNEYLRYGNKNTMNKNANFAWFGIRNIDLRLVNFRSIDETCKMIERLDDSSDVESVLEKFKGKFLSAKVSKLSLVKDEIINLAMEMAPDEVGILEYAVSAVQSMDPNGHVKKAHQIRTLIQMGFF